MKYIVNYIFITIFVVSIISCQEKYELDSSVNHSYVTTSFGNEPNIMQVNGWMTFIDLSRGVKMRKWEFPADAAIGLDSTFLVSSSEETVKASFLTPGQYTIKLHQEYNGNIYTNDGLLDTNLIDEEIVITVRDSVRAAFSATCENTGDRFIIKENAANEIQAGRTIQFQSESTGEPTSISWIITRSDGFSATVTGTEGIGHYKMSVPGTYNVSMVCSSNLGSSRIDYSNFITVIASTDPVTLDGIERSSSDEIGLVFSRAMDDANTCAKSAFNVSITNNGRIINSVITDITTADNIVKLKMDTKLYNSDEIKVSYDANNGDLHTSDAVVADSFTDYPLTDFKNKDVLAEGGYDSGFENTSISNWPYLWWGGQWEKYKASISSDMFHNGKKSLLVNMEAKGGMIIGHRNDNNENITFTLEDGKKYIIGAWIYMVDLGDGTSIPDLRFYWTQNTNWSVEGIFFPSDFPIGKWVYRSFTVASPGEGKNGFSIRGCNENNSENCIFYLDDLSMSELEERP